MDPYPEIKSALKSEPESRYVVPPPDLPRPPSINHAPVTPRPPPQSAGAAANPAVKVKIRSTPAADGDETSPAGPAPFNARVIAVVIDLVVALGVTLGLGWILPGFLDTLARLAGLAYLVTRDSLPLLGGQSVGKKAMKLKVVTLEGESLIANWQAALIRNGVLLIPLFAFVELYILLTREEQPEPERGRRLGDEWAKTRVILEEMPGSTEENN
jgi:uncharacterized RDD family membrane protein YckC